MECHPSGGMGEKEKSGPAFLQELKVWKCNVPFFREDKELLLEVEKIIGVSQAIEIHLQAQTCVLWDLRGKNFNGTQRVVGNGMNGGDPHIQNQAAEEENHRQEIEYDVMTGKLEGSVQNLVETHPLEETHPGEEIVSSPEKEVNNHNQNKCRDGHPDQSVHAIRPSAGLPINGISKAGQGHYQKFNQQVAAHHAHQDKCDCDTANNLQDSTAHL